VAWAAQAANITDEVVKQYDRAYAGTTGKP